MGTTIRKNLGSIYNPYDPAKVNSLKGTTPTVAPLPPPPPPPPGANTPQSAIPTTSTATTSTATGLPGVQPATTVPQTQKPGMQQQIPAYLLQELLMGARYNNPYMSGISGPYQAPQFAGLQNIAPWAMPQNPSMYGGGFLSGGLGQMPYPNNMQSPLPMNGAQMPYQLPDYYSVSGNYQNDPNRTPTNINSLFSSLAGLGAWR